MQPPQQVEQPTYEKLAPRFAKGVFDAAADPVNTNDLLEGWDYGSNWYRSDSGKLWICIDPTEGAASWRVIPGSGDTLYLGNVIGGSPTVSGVLYVGASNTLAVSPALGALQAARRNAANTAMEAFTPLTSVGLSLPAIFSVSGSPLTANGTISASLVSQSANTVFKGPNSGSPAAPTFAALVPADFITGAANSRIPYQNSSGVLVPGPIFDASGNLQIAGDIYVDGGHLFGVTDLRPHTLQNAGANKTYMATNVAGEGFALYQRNATDIPFAINADGSQSVNLFEVRGLGSRVASIDKSSNLIIGTARFLGYTSSANNPTTTELPNNKDWSFHRDTFEGVVYLGYNDSGTILGVALVAL